MTISKCVKKLLPVLLILLLASCGKKSGKQQQRGPARVNLYTVTGKTVSFYDTYPGTVVALEQVEIRSEVNGYVTGIFFDDGSQVKKGQKLYEIDKSNYQSAYDQAKASVDIAKANLDKARRDAERYRRLREQNAIATQTAQNALTELENARMQLESAKAGLKRAETNLGYAVIKAPFSGTIGFSNVRMGAYIIPGQTPMNTLSSDNPMGVDLQIDENELNHFLDIRKQKSTTPDSTFRLVLPGQISYDRPGHISAIDRSVDPQTGTIRVRLVFPNPDLVLRDGMSVTVKVLDKFSGRQIVIPFKAVVEQMSEYFVFVADSGKVHQRKITPGPHLKGELIVLHGLSSGEHIVAEGVQKLRDGMPYTTGKGQNAAGKGQNKKTPPQGK